MRKKRLHRRHFHKRIPTYGPIITPFGNVKDVVKNGAIIIDAHTELKLVAIFSYQIDYKTKRCFSGLRTRELQRRVRCRWLISETGREGFSSSYSIHFSTPLSIHGREKENSSRVAFLVQFCFLSLHNRIF